MNFNFDYLEDLLEEEEEDLYDLLTKENYSTEEDCDEDEIYEYIHDEYEYESEDEFSLTEDIEDEENIFDKYFENLY